MTKKPPIPCYLCGKPVRELGSVRWNGSGYPKDGYITGIFPVCVPCTTKPEVQENQNAPVNIEEGVSH